ncbi:hypothetical protein ACWDTT_15915 [Streptosporangium sandarakinum]
MPRNPSSYTGELLAAQAAGKRIVCSMQPYVGWEMTYDPRRTGDPKPWRITDLLADRFRYSGRECYAVNVEVEV